MKRSPGDQHSRGKRSDGPSVYEGQRDAFRSWLQPGREKVERGKMAQVGRQGPRRDVESLIINAVGNSWQILNKGEI